MLISATLIVMGDFGESNVMSDQRIKAFFSLHEPGYEPLKQPLNLKTLAIINRSKTDLAEK
jgi:hypothetical protein